MLFRLTAVTLLLVASFSVGMADSAGLPEVYVLPVKNSLPASFPTTTPDPLHVRQSIINALNGSLKYSAIPEPIFQPVSGFEVVSELIPETAAKAAIPKILLNLKIFKWPAGDKVGSTTIDITDRPQDFIVTQDEAAAAISGGATAPVHRAEVVIIDDGLPDSKTATSKFNGPAYVEARMVEELAGRHIAGMSANDYLSSSTSNSNTGTAVLTSGDDTFAAACLRDYNIVGLRYKLQYQESINPVFGSQNGSAHLLINLQRCTDLYSATTSYSTTVFRRNLGNSGLLNSQYFQFVNFLLTAVRKNQSNRGFFGTGGVVASSLLPAAADTTAESRAVGDAASTAACVVAVFLADQKAPSQPEVASGRICKSANDLNKP